MKDKTRSIRHIDISIYRFIEAVDTISMLTPIIWYHFVARIVSCDGRVVFFASDARDPLELERQAATCVSCFSTLQLRPYRLLHVAMHVHGAKKKSNTER